MAWGTDFKADIFLSRQSYTTKYEVQDKIKFTDELITDCEKKLQMYASATPKDIISGENLENCIDWLNHEITDVLDCYRESILERYRLELYLDFMVENENKETIKD